MAMSKNVRFCLNRNIRVTAEDIIKEVQWILAPTDFSAYSKEAVTNLAKTSSAIVIFSNHTLVRTRLM